MIGSVRNAIQILDCFDTNTLELGISEIAGRLDMNKSTVQHLVNTLREHGLLIQTRSRRYHLGFKLLKWAELVTDGHPIREVALPFMKDLVAAIGESIHLATLYRDEVVHLQKVESEQSIRISVQMGSKIPAYCSGLGKSLLASQARNQVAAIIGRTELVRRTPKTIASYDLLLQELELISRRGYSIDDEEYMEGLYCVAVPIPDYGGQVKYALSVAGPLFRMKRHKLTDLVHRLTVSASLISHALGGGGE
jgi:IclR family KDG regulon transcriptional repressor